MPALSSELFFGIPVGIFVLGIVGYNLNYSVKIYLKNGKNLMFIFYTIFLGLLLYQVTAFLFIIAEMGRLRSQF